MLCLLFILSVVRTIMVLCLRFKLWRAWVFKFKTDCKVSGQRNAEYVWSVVAADVAAVQNVDQLSLPPFNRHYGKIWMHMPTSNCFMYTRFINIQIVASRSIIVF